MTPAEIKEAREFFERNRISVEQNRAAIEHADQLIARIDRSLATSEIEVAEARRVLKRAGLLRRD
jgi:hypothetical protein